MNNSLKKIILNGSLKIPFIRKFVKAFAVHHEMLPEIFISTESKNLRQIFNLPIGDNSTQLNQDLFALFINKFRSGYFVEIGANDGYNLSNTVYLERYFGWSGLLIEPNPKYLSSLKTRNALISNKAVAKTKGNLEFIDAGLYGGLKDSMDQKYSKEIKLADSILVSCDTLEEIFIENKVPERVAFLSIDVEGNEKEILTQAILSTKYRFESGVVEHNFRPDDLSYFKEILIKSNYEIVWEGWTGHDLFFVDKNLDN